VASGEATATPSTPGQGRKPSQSRIQPADGFSDEKTGRGEGFRAFYARRLELFLWIGGITAPALVVLEFLWSWIAEPGAPLGVFIATRGSVSLWILGMAVFVRMKQPSLPWLRLIDFVLRSCLWKGS
jgi:hypothetical protein